MNKQVNEIPGLDTIRGLVGEPPKVIPVNREVLIKQQNLIQEWNPVYIAAIPFCFKCKEPLVWHSPPVEETLFHCPKCGRIWTQANWKGGTQNDNSRRNGQQREDPAVSSPGGEVRPQDN